MKKRLAATALALPLAGAALAQEDGVREEDLPLWSETYMIAALSCRDLESIGAAMMLVIPEALEAAVRRGGASPHMSGLSDDLAMLMIPALSQMLRDQFDAVISEDEYPRYDAAVRRLYNDSGFSYERICADYTNPILRLRDERLVALFARFGDPEPGSPLERFARDMEELGLTGDFARGVLNRGRAGLPF